MSGAGSSQMLPGGNTRAPLLTIKTLSPLPKFKTVHAVPPPDASISSFKLSLLLILTGAHSSKSSSKPLTASEELKEMTMQQWRLDMLTLELRQNSIIAPETRSRLENNQGELQDEDDIMTGFELLDDHECALLEEGDEVVIRLKPGHTSAEMKLPPLPANHKYAAPAGSLTRAGTLSAPPPYSVAPPTEPSSHSSSVAAQPNANFHAHKYRDYSGGWRVVRAQNGTTGVSNQASNSGPKNNRRSSGPTQIALNVTPTTNLSSSNPMGVGTSAAGGGGRAAAAAAAEKRINSGGRRMSGSNVNNAGSALDQRPSNRHVSSSSNNIKTVSSSRYRPQSAGAGGILSSENNNDSPSSNTPSPNLNHSSTFQSNNQSSTSQSQTQSPQFSTFSSQSPQAQSSASHNNSEQSPSSNMAASMPLTALVIGPGVQGQVGRNVSSPAAPMGTQGGAKFMGGNASAFVGFTAAGGEVQPRSKPRRKPSRNKSEDIHLNGAGAGGGGMGKEAAMNAFPPILTNSNAAADAAERRIAAEKARREEEEETLNGAEGLNKRARHVSAGAFFNSTPDDGSSRPGTNRTQTQTSTDTTMTRNTATTGTSDSSRVEIPPIQSLPPIQNLAPFPDPEEEIREIAQRLNLSQREEGLPPMPSAVGAPTVLDNEEGDLTVRPGINTSGGGGSRSRRESSGNGNNPREAFKNGDRKFSSSSNQLERTLLERKSSSFSVNSNHANGPLSFFRRDSNRKPSASTPIEDANVENNLKNDYQVDVIASSSSSSKGKEKDKDLSESKQSKAEKRYQEVQKALAKERQKQSMAEEARREEFRLKEQKKLEERKKKELEEKQKKVQEQWELWEEVRKREKELGLPPPKVEDRLRES